MTKTRNRLTRSVLGEAMLAAQKEAADRAAARKRLLTTLAYDRRITKWKAANERRTGRA